MSVALTSYPFDTQSVSESQWGQMAQLWLGDGVLGGVLNELAVSGYSGGMNVHVESGRCWIQGYFGENPTQQTLAIAASHPTSNRIDRIVLRMDLTNNQILLDVLTGAVAGSPSAPALTRTGTVWELSLAQVAVAAAATSIASGNVTDERNNQTFEGTNTTGVCGYAYSASPHARCKSTTRPTKWPVGSTIYEEDTGFVMVNTGTYAVPVWTRGGPAAFAVPALTLSTANAIGAANTYMRSDATLAIFDATAPSTQVMGDAAVVGTAAFASRRDHKHAMPSASVFTLAAVGTATAIAAFDAVAPTTSALADAAAVGAAAFAARRDHVHGREASPHLSAFKTADESVTASTTVQNDDHLFVTIPATSKWAFEFNLIVTAAGTVPGIKLNITTDFAGGDMYVTYMSYDAVTPGMTIGVISSFGAAFSLAISAGISVPVRISGYLNHTGGSTTPLRLKWAQVVSDAALVYVLTGSHLIAHRLA